MEKDYTVKSLAGFIKIIHEMEQKKTPLSICDEYIDNIDVLKKHYEQAIPNQRKLKYKKETLEELIKFYDKMTDSYNKIKKDNKVILNYRFYYRGHYDKDKYTLVPSVFREKNWAKEDYYYHEMIVRCANQFQNSTHLDRLVRMQHYGCPTRLMDITSNPLVALYFACENFGCEKCNHSNAGEVIIFAVQDKQISYFDSDKALMLSCLAKFSGYEKMQILDQIENSEYEFTKKANEPGYKNKNIEKLYHEISTEVPSFKRQIIPSDLITPIFIQPQKTNDRIVKQDGAFILCGLSRNEIQSRAKLEALCYQKITIQNKSRIKRELEALGINKATLFPEVDMVAEYLKECVQQAENQ